MRDTTELYAPPENREFYERTGHRIRVDTVQSQRAEPVKTSLWLLQGGVLFVLLIGCVNASLPGHFGARIVLRGQARQ